MDQFGAEEPAILYTQTGCADSARVRACFRRSGVPFVERNVTSDDEAAVALYATGIFATPLVVVAGRPVVGGRLPALAASLGFVCRCPEGGRG
ncbi:MAG: glutaredoxin family protein [Chloroflexia bacterium]|nr:glutaredoxin family protein [Chloroflexia bacterium]